MFFCLSHTHTHTGARLLLAVKFNVNHRRSNSLHHVGDEVVFVSWAVWVVLSWKYNTHTHTHVGCQTSKNKQKMHWNIAWCKGWVRIENQRIKLPFILTHRGKEKMTVHLRLRLSGSGHTLTHTHTHTHTHTIIYKHLPLAINLTNKYLTLTFTLILPHGLLYRQTINS